MNSFTLATEQIARVCIPLSIAFGALSGLEISCQIQTEVNWFVIIFDFVGKVEILEVVVIF